MQIKPIDTIYKGYRFRSRLEARWAVFFDAFNLPYRYEMEGFQLENSRYLPDFWLPNGIRFMDEKDTCKDVWVEIKPTTELSDPERKKIAEFVKQSGYKLLLVAGEPDPEAIIRVISYDAGERKLTALEVKWIELHDQSVGLISLAKLNSEVGSETQMALNRLTQSQQLISGFSAAKQARFDGTDNFQVDNGKGVRKICEACGADFLATQPYHWLCYSCYRRNRDADATNQSYERLPPVPASKTLQEQPEYTEQTTQINRRTLISIGAIALFSLVLFIGFSLRGNDTGNGISPTTQHGPVPSATLSPTARPRHTTAPLTPASPQNDRSSTGSTMAIDGPCNCNENQYNCRDFASSALAQACFDFCYPNSGDIHYLDSDGDKRVCELDQ